MSSQLHPIFISMMRAFSLILSFLFIAQIGNAQSRTWTSSNGKTVEAEFVSSDGKIAELKMENGKTAKVPLQSLSKEDRNYINETMTKGGGPAAAKGNFDQPWPKSSKDSGDYEVKEIKEGPDEYIYETPHFVFTSDAKIGKNVIKTLSKMFEATYEANKALPLNNMPWNVKGEKFKANLYEKRSSYLSAGGPSSSAGVFVSGGKYGPLGIILVPFESLGVKPLGSSYIIDRDEYPTTLIHEITHQMMSRQVKQSAWFSEGSAEYVANSPYKNGRFNFNNNRSSIVEKVTAYGKKNSGGRALGKDIKAPSLKKYMQMDYGTFVGTNTSLHYGLSPLLVYYFYHQDGKGDAARIKNFIKALQEGKNLDEAHDILLDGRTYNQLAKEITTFWRRSGITINFADSAD